MNIEYKKYPITIGLIGICVLVYLYTTVVYSPNMDALQGLSAGGYNPVYVFQYHQYYRLLSANFIHFGIMHIVVNCYSLYNIGCFIEKTLGRNRYITVVVVSAITTTLLPGILYCINGFEMYTVSGGISGVIFGLIGSLAALAIILKDQFMNIFKSLAMNLLLMIVISIMVPSISLSGHVSGFIGGFIATIILLAMIKPRQKQTTYYN